MKILFVVESLRSGGKERRLSELILAIVKLGHKVELILTENDIHYDYILNSGIKIHIIKRRYFKKDPLLFFKFYKIVRSFDPDVIHSWGIMTSFYLLPAKLLLSIPLLDSSITNTKPMKLKFIQRINFKFADLIASNTQEGLKSYGITSSKGVVIYNGFNFDRLNNLTNSEIIKSKFNLTTKFIVGMVGSFSKQKDYFTFIEAANRVLAQRDDIIFLCVGAGAFSEYYEKAMNKEKIKFLGAQKNIESIMNVCDIGVLISNSDIHGEGISNALMEFMSLSKPVIATNDGGTPELVDNNHSGFLVEPKDSFGLEKYILKLLDDEQLRLSMGIKSKQIIKSKFLMNQMLDKFLEQYRRLLNN